MLVVFISIGILGLFFALVGIRLLLLKNGEFRGTCASQNPLLAKDGETCGFCGKSVDECPNEESVESLESK